MACCTGQTECNHIITIGYLKTFTNGLIQNGSGVAQNVNMNALPASARTDSYCPTYAQLTGGSLIPIFVNAGNHKWSQNVDGITIKGTYDQTQCVKQEDLVATYTRFESLTITATPSTNISECGGNSTMTYTYTLRKYEKSMNTACTVSTTSTTNTDTTDSGDAAIVYTANQTWATINKPTVTLAKNGSHDSPARTVTVTGKITFRGTQHSTTATIGQKALTGDYKFWYHTYEIYSYDDVTVLPDYFDCNGGDWEATGYYTNHDWDVYRWQDSCGVDYNSDTVNRNHTYPSYTEFYTSGSVEPVDCESLPEDYTHTETINYHGKTTSWTQFCPTCSGDCPCGDTCRFETIHSGGTIPCTGGSVDILYDYLVKSVTCNPSTGERTETIVDSGESLVYTTVYANGCNKTSNPITYEYDVIQEAGPCCPTADVFTYEDVVIPCEGASTTTQTVGWTQVHTNPDTTTTTTTGSSSKTIPGASCNATSSRKLIQAGNTGTTAANANPAVYQAAGPCCPESDVFTFDDVTVACEAAASKTQSVGYTRVHTNPDTTKTTTTGTAERTIPAVECNPTSSTRLVQPGNTGATLSAANPKITQAAGPCCPTGDVFTFNDVTVACEAAASKTQQVGYTQVHTNPDGTTTTTTGTAEKTIPAVECNPNSTTRVIQAGNTGATLSAANPKITQAAGPCCCSCDDLEITTTPSKWDWDDTTPKTATIAFTSSCVDSSSISVDITGASASSFSVTSSITTSSCTLTITPTGTNEGTRTVSATIVIAYTSTGNPPCQKTFLVSQKQKSCGCEDITFTGATNIPDTGGSPIEVISFTPERGCFDTFSGDSSDTWITVLPYTSGNKLFASIGANTNCSARTGTVTFKYGSGGTLTCTESVSVTQNAHICTCSDITFNVTKTALDACGASTKQQIGTYSTNCATCIDLALSTGGTFTSLVVTFENGKIYATYPTTASAKSGTLILKYGGSNCSTINMSQASCCNCETDLTINTTPSQWNWNETTAKTATFSFASSCMTASDITVNVTGSSATAFTVTSALTTSSGTITIKPNDSNTSTTASRIATVVVKGKINGTDCSKSFVITQKSQGCSCEDMTVTPTPAAIPATGSPGFQLATFTVGRNCFDTFDVSDDANWLEVYPIQTGSNAIGASVSSNSTCESRTATITFKYGSGGTTSCTTSFTVTQEARSCRCSDIDFDITTTELECTGATNQQIGTYTFNCATCKRTALSKGGSFAGLTITFSAPDTNGVGAILASYAATSTLKTGNLILRYGTNECATYSLRQNKCCSCDDLEVLTTPSAWNWNDTSSKTATIAFTSSCVSSSDISVDITGGSRSWFTVTSSMTSSSGTFTITPSGTNTTITSKVATIVINYNSNGQTCRKTFLIAQKPDACSCEDMILSPMSGAIPASGGSAGLQIASFTFPSGREACFDTFNVSGDASWLGLYPVIGNTHEIGAFPSANNTCNVRTATVTLNYGSGGTTSCTTSFTVTQEARSCKCSDIEFTLFDTELDCSGGTDQVIGVYNISCATCLQNSISTAGSFSNLSVTCSEGNIYATYPAATAHKSGTLIFKYGSTTCHTESLTQEKCCGCGDFSISPTAATWAWNVTSVTSSITITSGACISDIILGNLSHFTATLGNSVITVKPKSNNTGSTPITETLTIVYKANGITCPQPKTVTLTHNPKNCECGDITITIN